MLHPLSEKTLIKLAETAVLAIAWLLMRWGLRWIRLLKNALFRRILDAFTARGMEVASSTFEMVGLPEVRVEEDERQPLQS